MEDLASLCGPFLPDSFFFLNFFSPLVYMITMQILPFCFLGYLDFTMSFQEHLCGEIQLPMDIIRL